MSFVLDNSVAMCWLLADGKPADVAYAEAVLDALREQQALVPSLWALEASNVIAGAEAKGLLYGGALAGLRRPPAATEHRYRSRHRRARLGRHPAPGPAYKLSAYDAAYLELALRTGLPLATLDADLEKAAQAAGVEAFAPN